jgi:TP53 regulating kinase-like protein
MNTPTNLSPLPLPPILTHPSATTPTLITQGAEALLYKTTYLLPSLPCALKYRPSKSWRHPTLDLRLTKHRILSEARVLVKCRREGVPVPAVYALDESRGWLMMEWIEGEVVRVRINTFLGARKKRGDDDVGKEEEEVQRIEGEERLVELMQRIGTAVGRMHGIGIVHGDLTTSNLMLKSSEGGEGSLVGEVILIDFGLASQSVADEDRAVDLYVLERAFGSTHPRAERLFDEVLKAYGESFKGAKIVLKRLEDVRMRGRKRSMLG